MSSCLDWYRNSFRIPTDAQPLSIFLRKFAAESTQKSAGRDCPIRTTAIYKTLNSRPIRGNRSQGDPGPGWKGRAVPVDRNRPVLDRDIATCWMFEKGQSLEKLNPFKAFGSARGLLEDSAQDAGAAIAARVGLAVIGARMNDKG